MHVNQRSDDHNLDTELSRLRTLLRNQDVDPRRLEGRSLLFAEHMATVHGLIKAKNYIKLNRTTDLNLSDLNLTDNPAAS